MKLTLVHNKVPRKGLPLPPGVSEEAHYIIRYDTGSAFNVWLFQRDRAVGRAAKDQTRILEHEKERVSTRTLC